MSLAPRGLKRGQSVPGTSFWNSLRSLGGPPCRAVICCRRDAPLLAARRSRRRRALVCAGDSPGAEAVVSAMVAAVVAGAVGVAVGSGRTRIGGGPRDGWEGLRSAAVDALAPGPSAARGV